MSFKFGSSVCENNLLFMMIPAEDENSFSIFSAICMTLRIDPIHLLMKRKMIDSLWIMKEKGLDIMIPNLELDPIPNLIVTMTIDYKSPYFQYVRNIEFFTTAVRKQYLNLEFRKEFLLIINGNN